MSRKGKSKGKPTAIPDGVGNIEDRRDENIVDDALKNLSLDARKAEFPGSHFSRSKQKAQDPVWYNQIPNLDRLTGSVAMNQRLGSELIVDSFGNKAIVPGIMALVMMPTYGISNDPNSALNTAANTLFIKLREVNSGFGKNYMPADVAMRVIATDNLYICYQDMMRAYGVIAHATWANKYLARTLVYAMGFDYDDLKNAGFQIARALKIYAEQINAIPLPTKFELIARHQYLAANYFMDGDSDKAQLFVPEWSYLWKYDNTGDTGTNLKLLPYHAKSGRMTFAQWEEIMNQLISAVMVDDDFAVMGGDILKAFGGNEVYKLFVPDIYYEAYPVHNELMLDQISNAFVPGTFSVVTGSISQVVDVNNSYVISNLKANLKPVLAGQDVANETGLLTNYKYLLNTWFDDPTPMDVIELTRFMPTFNTGDSTPTQTVLTFESLGSELLTDVTVYLKPASSIADISTVSLTSNIFLNLDEDTASTWLAVCAATQFHGYPAIRVYARAVNTEGTPFNFVGYFKNIQNYTYLSKDQVAAMNEAVMFSLFHVG